MTGERAAPTLRQQVVRGGTFLAARQAIGAVVGAGGTIVLTQQIGPGSYGLFIAAMGVFAYFNFVAQLGVNVYLIRREGPTDDRDYDAAFTLLLCLGVATASVGVLAMVLAARWLQQPGFAWLTIALLVGLPINVLALVPSARLERAMDYRRLAILELTNVFTLQAVSLAAAFAGMGAWSPVIGWWVQQIAAAALLYGLSGYRPRPVLDRTRARAMVAYGFGYSASLWVWQLRSLLNTLVVLPLAGPAAVGYVGLAAKFVETLSLFKTVSWRLSIAALTRLDRDPPRALRAMNEGMRLQVLGVGVTLAGFAAVAPYLMPHLFGARWTEWAPAMDVYPYLALSVLCNALFSLHTSVLYVLNRNWLVTIFHVVHVALLFAAAAWFVPRHGVAGVGYAEIAAMPAYVLMHLFVTRLVGTPDYGVAAAWAAAFGLLVFAPQLGWVACAGVLAAALWPQTWHTLREYVRLFRLLPAEASHG